LHANEIDTYESELDKLNTLILAKNEEIENLIQQNRMQKENFDEHQQDLKNEIDVLKEKLGDHHEVKEDEITALKDKLAHLHTVDINELKLKHEAYENSLIDELDKLKTFNA
jgi:phage host-nuclease inhibitor protein Gam